MSSDEGKKKRSIVVIICSIIQLVIAVLLIVFLIYDNLTPDNQAYSSRKPSEEETFETLLQNTEDSDPKTRLRAMDSLEAMLKDYPDKVDKKQLFMQMADVLSDEDPYVRYKAVTIFGYLGDPEAITCLKKALTQEADPRVRSKSKAVIKYLEMFEKK